MWAHYLSANRITICIKLSDATLYSTSRMNLHPTEIKDLERLQKYEQIFKKLLKSEDFAKPDIWASGESKGLIGMVINALIEEGSIIQNERGAFRWDQKSGCVPRSI